MLKYLPFVLSLLLAESVLLRMQFSSENYPDRPLSVCEVLGDLSRFNGKIITVRGPYFGTDLLGSGTAATREPVPGETQCTPLMSGDFEWIAGIYLEFPTGPDVDVQQSAQWTYHTDAIYQAGRTLIEEMNLASSTGLRYPPPVLATVVGRLDIPEQGLQVAEVLGRPVYIGYGPDGIYPARLVVVSIDDIRVSEVR